jgi:Uma2 family endonuclease
MASNPIHNDPAQEWPKRGGRMSEEEFHELERLNPDVRYEYIDGVAYMMSGGTVEHDLIADNVRAILRSRLRERSGSCNTFGENVQVLVGVKKNGKRHYLYPDTTVSCAPEDRRHGNTLVESPKLVIEVLSPGTEYKDRGVKFRAYQSCLTIQEIVLVNQFAMHVEIWQRDALDEMRWNKRSYDQGETVHFASVDIDVAMEELYQDVGFQNDEEDEE